MTNTNIHPNITPLALTLCLLLAACASSGPSQEEYQALQERINQLERQQQQSAPQTAPTQTNIQGYWEAPNGWIFLFKERIHIFVNPDGSFDGTGGFAANARQFTLQQRGSNATNTYTFDYTIVDSNSIRVTDTGSGNAWANGTWRKRTNIPGTRLNHRILGYWEGRDGDTTLILYFAGDDIVPAVDISYFGTDYVGQTRLRYGWAYSFDRENNLVSIRDILFSGGDSIFYGFDVGPYPIRFDGADLLVGKSMGWGEMPNTWIRFVRK